MADMLKTQLAAMQVGYRCEPLMEYKTVSAVAGPLVVMDKVKVRRERSLPSVLPAVRRPPSGWLETLLALASQWACAPPLTACSGLAAGEQSSAFH